MENCLRQIHREHVEDFADKITSDKLPSQLFQKERSAKALAQKTTLSLLEANKVLGTEPLAGRECVKTSGSQRQRRENVTAWGNAPGKGFLNSWKR